MKPSRLARFFTLFALIALTVSPLSAVQAKADGPLVPAPAKAIDERSVGIQMFMYPWKSIATECTNVLGPAGFDWIQISPPQEHIGNSAWWSHYQPVSYKLESSLGTRAEFINMVESCNTAGVAIIVDAVINHMANGYGTGVSGSDYQKYNYPGLYSEWDFHYNLPESNPNACYQSIQDYGDLWQNTRCELGGLPDLATETSYVRGKIADYLNDLINIGVAGFRVDAAKHFGSEDLQAVVDMLNPVNGQPPVIMSEVIGNRSTNQPFVDWGSKVWAWDMPNILVSSLSVGNMAFGKDLRWTSDFNSSSDTITMVSNHDTEHHGPSSLAYWQGNLYQLAHVYMLSIPYGIPEVYTGYSFSDENQGPNIDRYGMVTPMICPKISYKPQSIRLDGVFTCVQRWRAIQGMIKWRDEAGQAPMRFANYKRFTKAKALYFNRGDNWIIMNPTMETQKVTYSTRLAKGTYCDVISGGRNALRSNKTCVGTTVIVTSTGQATLTVPAQSAIAIGAFSKAK